MIFGYAEPFFSGRSIAEPLLLACLAAWLARRRWLAATCWALAASIHPLQALALLALAFGIGGAISFIRQAWSMRYQLSRDAIYFSPSVDDKESLTLPLTKIMQIYVIDRRPWSWLNLGTVILLVDPNQDAQPCMKCLRAPEQLAEAIKSAAEAAGADTIAIQVLN